MRRPGGRSRAIGGVTAAILLLVSCATEDTELSAPETPTESAPSSPAVGVPGGSSDEQAAPADEEAAPEVEAEPPGEAPEGRDELVADVEALVDELLTATSDADLALLVEDAEGRPIAEHQPEVALLPASTVKMLTAATILITLGPDARLRTHVESTAPIDGDGTLEGDLHLVGGGDPVLASAEYGRWVYPARPRTPLESLVDQLVDAGLTRVTGDVVGRIDDYAGSTEAEGWRESYFNDFNARRITGLTVDAGLAVRLTWPEDDAENGDEDADADEDGDDEDREPSGPPDVQLRMALNPSHQASNELVRLLEERDVRIDGEASWGEPDAPAVGRLAAVDSPRMDELLRFMVQRSDNHLADTLFVVGGRARTGEGSWERGERAAVQVLEHLGVTHDGLRMADGSGLSLDDRLTPRTLVELDRAMMAGRHADTWESLMAVAGESGTLSNRLRGTAAQGRLLAKTGTLRDVSALSGYVVDGDDRHHFALLANDATGTDRAVVRAFADDLALTLAADLRACAVAPHPDAADGPLGRPGLLVSC